MSEAKNLLDGIREVFIGTVGSTGPLDVTEDELREIDELRRFAEDLIEPEPVTYTSGAIGPVQAEFTVHFRNVVK